MSERLAALVGSRGLRPTSRFVFDGRALPAGLTHTRASPATYSDASGNLVEVGNNVLRPLFSGGAQIASLREDSVTNGVRNPRAEGLATTTYAAGLPNTATNVGGATNWRAMSRASGLSWDVSPITFAGRTGMRLRVYGTTSGSPGSETLEFELRNVSAAAAGIPITGSFECRLVAGALPALTTFNVRMLTFTNAGALVDNLTKAGVQALTSALTMMSHTITPAAGVLTDGWATVDLQMAGFPASTAVDFTIDLFCPQLETSSWASSRVLPPVGVPGAALRARDVLTVDSALLGEGPASYAACMALVPEFPNGFASARFLMVVGTGVDGPRVYTHSSTNSRVTLRSAGADSMFNSITGMPPGAFRTWAVAWEAGAGGDFSEQGNAAINDPSVAALGLYAGAPLYIGGDTDGGGAPIMIRSLRFWKGKRLSPAQLRRESARVA